MPRYFSQAPPSSTGSSRPVPVRLASATIELVKWGAVGAHTSPFKGNQALEGHWLPPWIRNQKEPIIHLSARLPYTAASMHPSCPRAPASNLGPHCPCSDMTHSDSGRIPLVVPPSFRNNHDSPRRLTANAPAMSDLRLPDRHLGPKRLKIAIACERCRTSKKKCDGVRPGMYL